MPAGGRALVMTSRQVEKGSAALTTPTAGGPVAEVLALAGGPVAEVLALAGGPVVEVLALVAVVLEAAVAATV